MIPEPLDLGQAEDLPLEERRSLTKVDDILVDPDSTPPPCSERVAFTSMIVHGRSARHASAAPPLS